MDWVTTVKAERRSPAERLPWLLTNARAVSFSDAGDGLWLKLLDVPAALAARRYDRSGALVIEILDRDAVDGEQRIRVALEASPDGSSCAATDRSPDLTIDASAIGAAYLGGTRLRDAALARGWDEHRPGAFSEADALFATLAAPWCSTFF
jgi:predicted acetyltransferase